MDPDKIVQDATKLEKHAGILKAKVRDAQAKQNTQAGDDDNNTDGPAIPGLI